MRALPDRVALDEESTELGDVKMYLYASDDTYHSAGVYGEVNQLELTDTKIEFLNSPFHGSSGSYSQRAYRNIGHWSPGTIISPLRNFSLTLNMVQQREVQYAAY